MDDVRNMTTGLLVENYRSLCRGIGATHNSSEAASLSRKADLYEEEILRRMAW